MAATQDLIDMNVENYSLEDLLQLFKLDYDFSEEGLKSAKKIVMQTHPDKSGLAKEYFLFFSGAYKILYAVYNFRNRAQQTNTEYEAILERHQDTDDKKRDEKLLQQMQKLPNFNERFNELFEKFHIKNEDAKGGYGDFMRSDDGLDTTNSCATMGQMGESFANKKKELQALVPVRDVQELDAASFGSDLTGSKPEYYSAPLFGSLPYEDLRKAHTETVIPITHDDYLKRPQYKNTDELLRDPNYTDVKPLSLQQSQTYLRDKEAMQSKSDVGRAYSLARQDEVSRKGNQLFMAGFKRLL